MKNLFTWVVRLFKAERIVPCLTILCGIMIFTPGRSNDIVLKDSLLRELRRTSTDTSRVNIYLKLGKVYKDFLTDTALIYLKKAHLLAKESGSLKHIAVCGIELGINSLYKGFYKESTALFTKSLKIYEELGDLYGVSYAHNQLGLVHWKTGNFKEGLKSHLKALELSEKLQDSLSISAIYISIGLIYWDQGISEKALEFYQKSLKIKERLKDEQGLMRLYNNVGLVYRELGDKNKALEYYLKSLDMSEATNHKIGMTVTTANAGRVFAELGDYDRSEVYYYEALRLARETKNKESEGVVLIYMSASYIIQKDFVRAKSCALEGLKLTKAIKARPFEKLAYENLAIISDSLGNYKDAYKYFVLFKALNDSIFNETNSKQIIEMQIRYDAEKKEKENELLKKDVELQQLTIHKEEVFRNLLIVIIGLVVLVAILLYARVKNKPIV